MMNSLPDQWIEYGLLCELMKTYELYEMVVEELYEVNSVMAHFSAIKILSEDTLKAAQAFQEKWYKIIEVKPYGKDRVFVYLDNDFQNMLNNELLSFLNLINFDLAKAKFPNIEYFNKVERKFPDNNSILERASILYELIINTKRK